MASTAKPNISYFNDHILQWVFALFLTRRELYKDYAIERYRQDYLFGEFAKFAENYYNLSGDEWIYFGTTRKQAKGEANITGGCGRMTGASRRGRKAQYYRIEESREKRIDDFAKKYGLTFEVGKDQRLFVGVTEIWNKLDVALEIVAASKWADVGERSYDDASFTTPIPAKLDKRLVPFKPVDIRCAIGQKMKAMNPSRAILSRRIDVDEEELEYLGLKENLGLNDAEKTNMPLNPVVFVRPPELDDEEW